MSPPGQISAPSLPRISPRRRTGAPPPRRDETPLRVLLWLAMIIGLLVGFALATVVAAALSAL